MPEIRDRQSILKRMNELVPAMQPLSALVPLGPANAGNVLAQEKLEKAYQDWLEDGKLMNSPA